MSPDQAESVLDRWARRDAAKAIMAELGISSRRAIYKVIEEARARHDLRAAFRKGRESAERPSMQAERPGHRRRRGKVQDGEPLPGWWFGKETRLVWRLGTGSVDCVQVPVSVSAVPRNMPQEPVGTVMVPVSTFRTFREALADWGSEELPQGHGGPLPTAPADQHQRR